MNFSNMEPDSLPTADDIRAMEQRIKDGIGKPITLQPKIEFVHPLVKARMERHPPDGKYDGVPCTCNEDCKDACHGGCGCEACKNAYGDFLSLE